MAGPGLGLARRRDTARGVRRAGGPCAVGRSALVGRVRGARGRPDLVVILCAVSLVPIAVYLGSGRKLVAEGMSRKAARKQAASWLDRVGLAERRDHPPERLSTGERQRVAIARALANRPESMRRQAEGVLGAGDHLASHLGEAPVICVFCFDPTVLHVTDQALDRTSVVGGASICPAIQNLLLACRAEGLATVAVWSDPDRGEPHVRMADEAVGLGGSTPLATHPSIPKAGEAGRAVAARIGGAASARDTTNTSPSATVPASQPRLSPSCAMQSCRIWPQPAMVPANRLPTIRMPAATET